MLKWPVLLPLLGCVAIVAIAAEEAANGPCRAELRRIEGELHKISRDQLAVDRLYAVASVFDRDVWRAAEMQAIHARDDAMRREVADYKARCE